MAQNGIDRDELVALTQRLVRIPSQYIEGACSTDTAADLADYLRGIGD